MQLRVLTLRPISTVSLTCSVKLAAGAERHSRIRLSGPCRADGFFFLPLSAGSGGRAGRATAGAENVS